MPQINWLLLVCVLSLVLAFGSSLNLAAANGIPVAGTMVITTGLLPIPHCGAAVREVAALLTAMTDE